MKRIVITLLLAALQVSAITVDEILDKMEANETPKTQKATMTQKSYSSDGRESVSELISWSIDEGDKGLTEYVSPARIKGMKILMLNDGDDIWFYSARTGRVRKIASHQKNQSVNNSDFSYEDMSSSDWREDYTVKLDGEEQKQGLACYKIVMTPKTDEGSYSKIIFWADKERFIGVYGEYYDEDGKLWKKLYMKDPKKVGEYWTMKSVEMHNVIKGSKTIMEMGSIEYDIDIDPAMFSERNLKR
jgi:hypothetical protein